VYTNRNIVLTASLHLQITRKCVAGYFAIALLILLICSSCGILNSQNAQWQWTRESGKYLPVGHPETQALIAAFDNANDTDVLLLAANNDMTTTWVFNGKIWNEMHSNIAPAEYQFWDYQAMAYDSISKTVILQISIIFHPQTWSWNGYQWELLNPGSNLPRLKDITLCSDPVDGGLLAVIWPNESVSKTWHWNGLEWVQLHPRQDLPATLRVGEIAPDYFQNTVIYYGGIVDRNNENLITWIWKSDNWYSDKILIHYQYTPFVRVVDEWNFAYAGNTCKTIMGYVLDVTSNNNTVLETLAWQNNKWVDLNDTSEPNDFPDNGVADNVPQLVVQAPNNAGIINISSQLQDPYNTHPEFSIWKLACHNGANR
jgi:hypothetical protein